MRLRVMIRRRMSRHRCSHLRSQPENTRDLVDDFITGLTGAIGGTIDPLTNDFMFATFGAGHKVIVVQGFSAPVVSSAPEPGTLALLALGGVAVLAKRRHK